MQRLSFNFGIALFAFVIGVASVTAWLMTQTSSTRQLAKPDLPLIKASAVNNVEPATAQDCSPAFVGRYSNYDYAYSVVVPKGMIGFGACVTNHGFGINLLNPTSKIWTNQDTFPKAYLFADASYNAGDWESFDDAIKENVSYLEGDKATDITLSGKTTTRLAGLRAVRFIARYRISGEIMVSDTVLAFRKEKHEEIVYTISLTTPLSRYDKDKEALIEMQKTWRLQPQP